MADTDEQPDEAQPETSERIGYRVVSAEYLKRTLADHAKWVETEGKEGKRADLHQADLHQSDLGSANLRGAVLERANLRGANLRAAVLRKAILGRAEFTNAVLSGADLQEVDFNHVNLSDANLEQANLRLAKFGTADLSHADLSNANLSDAILLNVTGLQADKLAGANLSNAKLPGDIAKFEGVDHVEKISKHARTNFLAVVGSCVFSWLTIAQTTDVALVTGSSATPLPIIQTPVPITGFYWAAPAILFTLYLYLHLYLQRMWEGLASLPAIFPSGRTLDQQAYPWLLSGLVSAYVPLLGNYRPAYWQLQVGVSIVGAWMLVPFTLLLFWGRYLPRHDWSGTLWQIAFLVIAIAVGVASYRLAAATLRGEIRARRATQAADLASKWKKAFRWRESGHQTNTSLGISALALAIALSAISYGAINGVRTDDFGLADPEMRADPQTWVPSAFAFFGYGTFANLLEADVSTKPGNWTGLSDRTEEKLKGDLLEKARAELAQVKRAGLRGANLRHADAFRAFLAKADLFSANLQGAFLGDANLQEAILSAANLQNAYLRGADLRKTKLDGANLQKANLDNANLQNANLRGADLTGARNLVQTQLDQACGDEDTKLSGDLKIKPCPE